MDRKISQFLRASNFPSDAVLTFVSNGKNYGISYSDFLAAIGFSGSVSQGGAEGVPVLDQPVANASIIRNINATTGLKLNVTPTNGLLLETELLAGGQGVQVLVDETVAPRIRSIQAGDGITITSSSESIQISTSSTPVATNTIVVNSLSDLPSPSAGVINLSANTVYLFSTTVDLGNNTLNLNSGTTIRGSGIFSTGIVSATTQTIITQNGDYRTAVENIFFDCPNAKLFDIQAATPETGIFVCNDVIVQDCESLGSFTDIGGVSFRGLIVLLCSGNGLDFSGAINVLNFDSAFIQDFTGVFADFDAATFNIVNIENANIVSTSPTNQIVNGLSNSGNINVGGSGSVRAVNILGPYTANGNILPSDIRWNFSSNVNIQNSKSVGYLTMVGNAIPTPIAVINTPVKCEGVFTAQLMSRFSTDNTARITYIGQTDINVDIRIDVSLTRGGGGAANDCVIYVAKNGVVDTLSSQRATVATNTIVSISAFISDTATNGDYFELFVANATTTNAITVVSAKLSVSE